MKTLFIASALATVLLVAPAIAQTPPPAETPQTEATPTESGVIIAGLKPSDVLGAIDTSKLVDGATETPDPEVAEAKAATRPTAIAALPDEVQDVVENGDYTTEDLVAAQLASIARAPVPQGNTAS